MAEKDLIPFNKMSKEEARKLQSKGGSVTGSPRKSLAKHLYWLKKRGIDDENADKLYEVLTHPDLNALDIKLFLEKLRMSRLSPSDNLKLGQLMINWHKAHFGEKSFNVNVTANVDKTLQKLKDFLGVNDGQD